MLLKKWKLLLSASLAVMLLVLTGCSSLAGFDASKVMVNGMKVTSSESNSTIAIEVVPGDNSSLPAEDKAMFELIKSIKLTFDNTKQQDENVSTTGKLSIGTRTVPFKFAVDKNAMTIQIEGAKKPIVLDLKGQDDATLMLFAQSGLNQKELQDKIKELAPTFADFFVKNATTPKGVSVKSVTEKINGESVSLVNLHGELNGADIIQFVKELLTNISKDEKGLKDLIGSLYDVGLPIVKEAMKQAPEAGELPAMFEKKELAVGFIYQAIVAELPKVIEGLDSLAKEDAFSTSLLKDSGIKFDVAVDSSLNIRKQNVEFNVKMPEGIDKSAPKSINVKVTNEYWNVNKPVKVDTIDTSAGAIVVNPADPNGADSLSLPKMLKNLDTQSDVYKLLVNDFKVTKKNINLFVEDEADAEDYGFPTPYKANSDTTMVPARFVAQSLDGLVKWDEAANKITITDEWTGKVIVLTIDSKTALVDGKSVDMDAAATLKNGSTFVPLRFIADQFGAKVAWNEEAQLVTITRD
ncbi:copper amine oxidase N-terminal domain-containing protein [Paenibacillus sp. N1-5-1-14]|uniref:copper amine oxidase N-terminal domain-containing protein n=1 Tax=Paenibacillus radicibacter TaxID=2972488 RepID=UPI0021591C7B|nr:copper amine oxidase N-terminal domain-containing protein [Paenibacillus radicibacter]MCR8645293.1 copper amine oxidase N-terminal domain-containing protein [Paenibacillus radicibacter]